MRSIKNFSLSMILLIGVISNYMWASITPLPHSCPWGLERNQILVKLAGNIMQNSKHEYPISDDVVDIFEKFSSQKMLIFAYGSLINKDSAAITLSLQVLNTYQPAIAFGVKRVFNINLPFLATHWGNLRRPNDTAMLDIIETHNSSDIINGILLEVDKEEFVKLIERERVYKLIPVPVMLWEEALNAKIENPQILIAYSFSVNAHPQNVVLNAHHCVNPVLNYAIAIKKGAAQYGESFLNFLLSTTFLADQKTKFSEWLSNPHIDMRNNPVCIKKKQGDHPKPWDIEENQWAGDNLLMVI